jgi:hypothetical protein
VIKLVLGHGGGGTVSGLSGDDGSIPSTSTGSAVCTEVLREVAKASRCLLVFSQ